MKRTLHFFATFLLLMATTNAWGIKYLNSSTVYPEPGKNTYQFYMTGEDQSSLFDGSVYTKWCFTQHWDMWWDAGFEFEIEEPTFVAGYKLATANDTRSNYGRNPRTWKLYGKLNLNDEWTEIDDVQNDSLLDATNYTYYNYLIKKPGRYKYFRFMIENLQARVYKNNGGTCQLSEFELIEAPDDAYKVSAIANINVDEEELYWGTLFTEQASVVPNGVKVYTVQYLKDDDKANITLVNSGSDNVIPAGAYLVAAPAKYETLYFEKSSATPSDAAKQALDWNMLRGDAVATTHQGEGTYYILGRTGTAPNYKYGLYWQNGTNGKSVTNAAGRAYLLVTTPSQAAKSSLSLTFGEVTGVEGIKSSAQRVDNGVYNLNGVKVDNAFKGIVIENGKKVIK